MKPKTTVTLILIILPCLIAFAQTGGETFTDMRDGKTYRTVKIGKFMWMAENLNFVTDSTTMQIPIVLNTAGSTTGMPL